MHLHDTVNSIRASIVSWFSSWIDHDRWMLKYKIWDLMLILSVLLYCIKRYSSHHYNYYKFEIDDNNAT